MAQKKKGDLRLLKDGVAFGPTDRAGLEQLLASGRISPADWVSVRSAGWIAIAEYLAAPANDKPAPAPVPVTPASHGKKGTLRVINGGRIIGSLRPDQVEQLRAAGRIGEDDLICAVNGPWMRVADFFAPPPAPVPMSITVNAPSIPPVDAETARQEPVKPPLPTARPARGPAPDRPGRRLLPPRPVSQPPAPPQAGGYRIAPRRPAPPSTDDWYVRVRGMHSALLRKHHVKALYEAKEVTRDCLARHGSWRENDWRPIHSIAQLADIVQER